MKNKQLINLFQLQCKIQNPINLKMNRKNLKRFTSQSPITQMFQNFMIFIYSSVIFFFFVCFFLQPYILIIYESIKFQSNIFLTEEVHSGNFTHCRQTLNNWLKFIWSKIWKANDKVKLFNFPNFTVENLKTFTFFTNIRSRKCDIYVLKYWWSASTKLNEIVPF